jgi:hypothetical protein
MAPVCLNLQSYGLTTLPGNGRISPILRGAGMNGWTAVLPLLGVVESERFAASSRTQL